MPVRHISQSPDSRRVYSGAKRCVLVWKVACASGSARGFAGVVWCVDVDMSVFNTCKASYIVATAMYVACFE